MFNIDCATKDLPEVSDHPCRILIVRGSESERINTLFNLINYEPDNDKTTKDRYKAKYKLLINKKERTGLEHLNGSKAFIVYSNDMHGIYKNVSEQNPDKK